MASPGKMFAGVVPVAGQMCRLLMCFVGGLVLFGSVVQAYEGYSDPLRPPPADEVSMVSEIPFYKIGARLKRIEELIEQEKQALDALAPLQPAKQFDAFGYHSDYIPAVEGVPEEPLWTLDFVPGAFPTRAFVMVPALDQRSSDLRGYAFPKRFRICSVDDGGKRGKVHVDWTKQDFPDPGMRPVYFAFPPEAEPMGVLRLEVFGGHEENGLEFFSLGRIHPIRQGEKQKTVVMSVSSSFESAPYWSQNYLSSPRQVLGMPLSAQGGVGGNLVMELPAARLKKPLLIRVELNKTEQLGWVNLFPGQSPDRIDVPGYGFPKEMKIHRIVRKSPQGKEQRFLLVDRDMLKNPGNNMLRIAGGGSLIDALEIECNDFPVYQGQAVLSLGEIEIIKSGRNLSRGRRVTLRGIGLKERSALGALVDGKVGGRDILHVSRWLRQLAAGKPHEVRLEGLEAERLRLTERWQLMRERALVALGLLVLAGGLAVIVFMRRSRKRAQVRLRRQIHSDLHDDVGSSLGSISLIAEQLRHADVNEEVREDLSDLALISREAWASLREVVWVIDKDTVRLPVLIHKLTERAQRVLVGVDVSVEVPQDCPDRVVSLTFKRHMIMFFKEVVHNCARHAHATQVWLDFRIVAQQLQVSVCDNGCGFDLAAASTGQGLESIRNRAQEMGGDLDLDASPGEGTRVVLRVPLKALLNQTDHSYKTSN
ncbi:MAG: hypothetical protein H7A51_11945 [Akkermansiaceae bacterium]|nr:hypothetical protein [Akkermansiaceae bacterium]